MFRTLSTKRFEKWLSTSWCRETPQDLMTFLTVQVVSLKLSLQTRVQKIIFHSFFSIMGLNFQVPFRWVVEWSPGHHKQLEIPLTSLSFLLTSEGKKETKPSVVTTLLSAETYCTSTSSWVIGDHQSPQSWLHFNYFWALLRSTGQMWVFSHAIYGHWEILGYCFIVLQPFY